MSRLIFILLLGYKSLGAHTGEPLQPHDLWYAWSWDLFIVLGLGASALLFQLGASQKRGISLRQMTLYWLGWFLLVIALISPLHAAGEALFSAHMAQHELIMVGAAPLLVLGRPLVAYLWVLPAEQRGTVGKWNRKVWIARPWYYLSKPLHASWLHFLVLWGWHVPILFQATLRSAAIHAAQHLSFFFSALLFWWALINTGHTKANGGVAAFYLFTTMIHTGVLGALLTFSTTIWYPVYSETVQAWGLTALADQQLGGLIMLVPPFFVYLGAFLIQFGFWVRDSDRRYRDAPWTVPEAKR